MKEKVNISFEILILNELYRKNVIDRTIYDMALKEIKKQSQETE